MFSSNKSQWEDVKRGEWLKSAQALWVHSTPSGDNPYYKMYQQQIERMETEEERKAAQEEYNRINKEYNRINKESFLKARQIGKTNTLTDWWQSASTDYDSAYRDYGGLTGAMKPNEEALKKLVPTQDKKVPNDEALRNLGRKLGYDVPKEETGVDRVAREYDDYDVPKCLSTAQQNMGLGYGQVIGSYPTGHGKLTGLGSSGW